MIGAKQCTNFDLEIVHTNIYCLLLVERMLRVMRDRVMVNKTKDLPWVVPKPSG